MYIKVIPICWQWQQSCSSERDALSSLVLQGNEYWAYEVSATVRWLTLSLEPNTSRTYMGLCTVHVTPYPHSHNIYIAIQALFSFISCLREWSTVWSHFYIQLQTTTSISGGVHQNMLWICFNGIFFEVHPSPINQPTNHRPISWCISSSKLLQCGKMLPLKSEKPNHLRFSMIEKYPS